MSIQAETWDSGSQSPRSVAEAFAYCERLARTHYENFPVGSLLIPETAADMSTASMRSPELRTTSPMKATKREN